jgi:hypothetical protein
MRMEERHEHGNTTCAYEGVNGVNFCVIAQSFALSLPRQLFESLRFINSVFFRRPECTPSSANRRLDSIRSRIPLTLA